MKFDLTLVTSIREVSFSPPSIRYSITFNHSVALHYITCTTGIIFFKINNLSLFFIVGRIVVAIDVLAERRTALHDTTSVASSAQMKTQVMLIALASTHGVDASSTSQ